MRRAAIVGAGLAALATPAPAQQPAPTPRATQGQTDPGAQQPAGEPGRTTGRRDYDAAYFARYQPATALDVVERVPGFSLEVADETVRGFSGAAGNVVINGQRPSSKTDTLRTVLARIPASRVLRVEIGPGDLYGADYTGKSQVVNLVLAAGGGLATTVQAGVRRDFTGKLFPEGSVSGLLRRGRSTFNASLTFDNAATSEEGHDLLLALPDRDLLEYRRKVNRIAEPAGAVALSWDWDGGTNRTAHLNGRFAVDRFRLTQSNHVVPTGGAERDDRLTQRYARDDWELGGDVTRPFLGGGLKLLALATQRTRDNRDVSLIDPASGLAGSSAQALADRLEETLGRVVWTRADLSGWAVDIGVEGVVNRLRSHVDLFALQPGGGRTRIDLPVDDVTVRELRGEAFLNAGRPLGGKLRLDVGVTLEASRLSVRGDAESGRTLRFLKPKVVLDWRPSSSWHGQLSLQRTVAQLQFEDFVSSAELTNDRVNGGNADLLPQRAWEALATLEHPILGDGLVRVEAGYNRVSLVQDRVPTPEGFDAPGNLGSGTVRILRTRLEAPLKTLGVPGGRLTLTTSYVGSSVTDPYTGRRRAFSGNALFLGEASFRQDWKRFAWGVTASASTASTAFRLDELDRLDPGVPVVGAFAEWRPAPGTLVTLALDNAIATQATRRRTFFTPDRRTPRPDAVEYRFRNRNLIPSLTVKKSFG
jgi:hypothetical protein